MLASFQFIIDSALLRLEHRFYCSPCYCFLLNYSATNVDYSKNWLPTEPRQHASALGPLPRLGDGLTCCRLSFVVVTIGTIAVSAIDIVVVIGNAHHHREGRGWQPDCGRGSRWEGP